jgi:hypothetical protein
MARTRKTAAPEPDKPTITDEEILTKIAEGESLRAICRDNGLKESSVRYRFATDETLSAQYAQARVAQAHHYAEKVVDEALDAKDAQIGRLRMDALKWAAGKLAPKLYGDKLQVDTQHDLSEEMKAWLDQRA